MKNIYEIAGMRFAVESDRTLINDKFSKLFLSADHEYEWKCTVKGRDYLPGCRRRPDVSESSIDMYFDEKEIRLEYFSQTDHHVMSSSSFSVSESEDFELEYLKNDGREFEDISHIWPYMDLPYQLLKGGAVTIHSSSIENGGKAILFTAASQVGKSTQARLWNEHRNAAVLNGDKNILRMIDGKPYACGIPLCGTSGICTEYELPLGAVVLLSQAPENTVRRLRPAEAIGAFASNSFGHMMVPWARNRIVNVLSDIVSSVPVYHLACTPDVRAVEALEREMGGNDL